MQSTESAEDEDGRSGAAHTLAALIVRFRFAVISLWIVAAAAVVLLLPNVEQAQTGTLGDLVPSDADAIETETRSVELFSFPVLSRTVVVERDEAGLSPDRVAEIYARAAELSLNGLRSVETIVFALPITDEMVDEGRPRGPRTALTYLFFPPEIGPVGRTGLADRLVDRYVADPSIESGVTGAVPARGEQITAIRDALPLVELATVLLVTLAVGLHFRSIVAPLVNIFTVGLAYVLAVRLLGGVGTAIGVSIPQEVEPVMVALLFGIVTDYLIFFLSRFRGALARGEEPQAAAVRSTAALLPIIVVAALSVAAAAASLIVAQLGFYRAFGPGLALAVLIAGAVVLTFVPAAMAVLGPRLFASPFSRPAGARGLARKAGWERLRRRLIDAPLRRPGLAVVLTVVPLLAMTALCLNLNLANTLISGLPADSPPKEAYRLAGEDFPPGAIAPTTVLVEGPGLASRDGELAAMQDQLSQRRNISRVFGPASVLEGTGVGATTSPTGEAIRFLLVLDVDPLGARAINTVDRLQSDLDSILADAGLEGATASLAGDTAISYETVRETTADLGRILPAAGFVVFIVLAFFLRALIAPAYLVLASLLGLGAALGLTVLVFQYILGYGELSFYVPFAGIVLLIALGSDYNVYLVGRIWDEARHRPLREAIAVAGERATAAITVAGIVLALSFAALALVPLRPFRELAFLLSIGLLIDAFIVRSILAPALIALVGERSGWPGRSLRRQEIDQ